MTSYKKRRSGGSNELKASVHKSLTSNRPDHADGVLECLGRIQGKFPAYLPADALFTRKLAQPIHVETLHGGVTLTMAAVREEHWIPKLRKLVKSARSACWSCKRFQASPLTILPPWTTPHRSHNWWSSIRSYRHSGRTTQIQAA